jgi:urease accessory protein
MDNDFGRPERPERSEGADLLFLWQLSDSAFPSGGFAHSGGLEAILHHGEIHDSGVLWRLICDVLVQAGHGSLPLVTAAHADRATVAHLDALCDAFLSNSVANRASRAQGYALLTTCVRAFSDEHLAMLHEGVRRGSLCGHLAPVFGAVASVFNIGCVTTQHLFLFVTCRGVISAAVRLGILGVYEAQRLQRQAGFEISRVVKECDGLGPLEIAQTAPLLDLFQSTHDRVYSKLFQS